MKISPAAPLPCPVAPAQKYWDAPSDKLHRFVSPRMMRDAFAATPTWQSTQAELSRPLERTEEARRALAWTHYGQKPATLLRALASRTWTLQRRNKIFIIIRTFQVALMAFVVSTVFWREEEQTVDDGN